MENRVEQQLNTRIRRLIILFMIGLALSGITAFPLVKEIAFLHDKLSAIYPAFVKIWINKVYTGINAMDASYPFMAYGTDWLAFAHVILALLFIGPYIDPVRNIWVIQFGRIACFLIFPLAFICGSIRGIPFWWQLIDCSFGVGGLILLTCVYRNIQKLESMLIYNNL